jgi:RNA polymerase sigma-54 factor
MGSMDFRTEQRQQQTLSPRLQHAVRLLQLSSLEFAQQVHDALGKNPFLEEDGDPDEPPEQSTASEEAQEAQQAMDAANEAMAPPEGDLPGEGDRDMWQADGLGSGKRADDDETSALDMMAVPTSLATHLHGQLAVLPLTLRDLVLAKVIVESLDDDGYLRTPLEEMIEVADLDPAATLEKCRSR